MSTAKRKSRRSKHRTLRKNEDWTALPDDKLLDVRICDLGLKIEGTRLEQRIEKLYEELENRGIRFRPHCWLSDEWFSPDGVPGIAIPFYMAHARLARLERNQMLEVEGGTKDWCMKILRHEAGHTIDTAYRLSRRRSWREVFGKSSEPYPDTYQPKPYSKSFVVHLEAWYAQSHPAEDFAETFAVWLKPRSAWRTQYDGWPAMRKLEYVDETMRGIQNRKPLVTSRERVDSLRSIRKTLRDHYAEKRERYGIGENNFYDHQLRRLFSADAEYRQNMTAAMFLRRYRREIRQVVSYWTGQYQYTVDQVINDMIARCRELNLRLCQSEAATRRNAQVAVTVTTMKYLHGGYHKVSL